jgi:ribosomal protein L11 methyltransferase
VIVPSWLDEAIAPDEVELRLDPGMAFGTGLHPTTRGCLTLLQRTGPMPPRVLDVGSGSGILALAALRLGAGMAECMDTDPVAVETTLANAAANGFGDRLTARVGSLPVIPRADPYPLVLANLVASVLVELAEPLAARTAPDGRLVASGIIEGRGEEVIDTLQGAGFALQERLDDGEWVSLLMIRA